jgi:hypothetical protein
MKKEIVFLDEYIFSDDYKLAHVEMEIIKSFESAERWLYLGADATNASFARIGITMGDLRSRSYSSANPNYYLFCAFKCRPDLSMVEWFASTILAGRRQLSWPVKRGVVNPSLLSV